MTPTERARRTDASGHLCFLVTLDIVSLFRTCHQRNRPTVLFVRLSLFLRYSSHELSPRPRHLNSAPNSRSVIVSFSLEPPRLFLDFSAPYLSSTAQQLSSASAALARPRLFSASAALARPRLFSASAAVARPRLSSVSAALARPRLSSDSAAPARPRLRPQPQLALRSQPPMMSSLQRTSFS